MANKRMFTMKICDSDAFLDMPLSSQCLYFHLNMRADDDGFIDNPKRILKIVGASQDDLNILIAKRFVLTFENGVIVIKHWRMHNTLSKQRYHETQYVDEKNLLKIKENGSYSFSSGEAIDDTKTKELFLTDKRRTSGEQVENADLDLDLDSDIDLGLENKRTTRFKKPSLEEVQEYIREKGYKVDAEKFIDYYESNGWKVGKNPMKDWKATVRNWNRNDTSSNVKPKSTNKFNNFQQRNTDYDALQKKLLGY